MFLILTKVLQNIFQVICTFYLDLITYSLCKKFVNVHILIYFVICFAIRNIFISGNFVHKLYNFSIIPIIKTISYLSLAMKVIHQAAVMKSEEKKNMKKKKLSRFHNLLHPRQQSPNHASLIHRPAVNWKRSPLEVQELKENPCRWIQNTI